MVLPPVEMVIVFEPTGEFVKQGVAFEVIVTVTESPLTNVVVVNMALLVPTFVPFNFHW